MDEVQTRRRGRDGSIENKPKDKDASFDPAKGDAEEVERISAAGQPSSGSLDILNKGSEESKSQSDVLYVIDCENKTIGWKRSVVTPKNPFEKVDLGNEATVPPRVVGVFMQASGTGSLGMARAEIPPGHQQPTPLPAGLNSDVDKEDEGSGISALADGSEESVSAEDRGEEDRGEDDRGEGDDHEAGAVELSTENHQLPEHTLDLGTFRAGQISFKTVQIHSRNLMKLLRSVVHNHPKQSLEGDWITVNYPFEMLAHYYEDLVMLRDGQQEETSERSNDSYDATEHPRGSSATNSLDAATKYDLDILLKAFKPIYIKYFTDAESKYKSGSVSYTGIWFLFKPGTRVYGMIGGKMSGFVIEWGEETFGQATGGKPAPSLSYDAHCWNLTYNGRRIVRTSRKFTIKAFRGSRQIVSLPVFPAIYLDSSDGGKTKRRLEDIGEKFYTIVRQCPAHMHYSGTTWNVDDIHSGETFQRRKLDIEYTGEIVVDPRRKSSYRSRRSHARRLGGVRDRDSGSDTSDFSSEYDNDELEDGYSKPALFEIKGLLSDFRSIDPKEKQYLTPQHYFLFPRRMDGFGLAQKERMSFEVENIRPIVWQKRQSDPMSSLILNESDKDVIKSISKKHSRGLETWGADSIGGKGEGQIILLHGPPGTGKTFTVECVAKYTRRPLLRLTVADIGTDERDMESILGNWFQRGADWGAIILIDEADVFLEKRQVKDLQRNSLVSVFLNCVEYYTGMLFLTTNRIGQIDDAFLSRTTVAITYKALDIGKQKQIWQGFLKKLAEERNDISLTDRAKKFVENLDEDEINKGVPWNGREIRNALQTAIALATFDAEVEAESYGARPLRITVRPEHFQAVIDRRKEFIEYRKSIRNQDEEARAYTEGSRAPPPRKT